MVGRPKNKGTMIVSEQKKLLIAADEVPAPCWDELKDTYQLYFARDGYEAFRMLSEHHFHFAFLDIFLFGYDGLYLLRYIQENGLCGRLSSAAVYDGNRAPCAGSAGSTHPGAGG